MTSNSKKLIASYAALQILLYHCWIPVLKYGTFPGALERFLVATTYSGVDMFFFISAYSLVSRPVEDYKGFIKNRALKLLPLFVIALFTGHFLWFIPSIMIMYLLLPPLYRICRKKPLLSFFLLIAGWIAVTYLILGVIRPKQDIGIFLFRIPSIILGAYAVRFKNSLGPVRTTAAGLLLIAAGTALTYKFGYINKLDVPFRSTFYLTGIPVMLGTVMILNLIGSKFESRAIKYFGSMTLELYFTQMVFGTMLVNLFFRLAGSRIITNIAVLLTVFALSALIKLINDRSVTFFRKRRYR